jgi:Protein of unknown function (DUF1592)/Protein of unknown function (DUF1588)/Protein of unknown function (DUF1595)/Protein of unknown function (DUF1587)/Protein of unknown function (DUF1585)
MRTFARKCGAWVCCALATLTGCYTGMDGRDGQGGGIFLPDDGGDGADDDGPGATADVPPPLRVQLRRLTRAQYFAAVQDLLGAEVVLPTALEPDLVADLYATVGATQSVLSELGAEQLETAARDLAEQVVADPNLRTEVVGCDPAVAGCVAGFVTAFGRRAFRRPLEAAEQTRYETLASELQALHGDPWEGVEGVLTAVLASAHFLYVVELGEADPEDEAQLRFTSVEMASRLSLALWGSLPDEALMAAGEAGELVEPEAIAAQTERMLADPRARRGLGRFFAEWLGLDVLDGMTKDTAIFPQADPALFSSMRMQVERMVDDAVFEGGSLLDLVDSRRTFVDARLATLYGVSAPASVDAEGFGEITLPEELGRRGIMGTGAFLAMQSRRTRTSPTLRGVWVQARLRCNELPPPPPDVEVNLPDGDEASEQTLREILESHRENPTCAGCHALVDPIGLTLENFDGMGAWRTTDRGEPIDASVELEGVEIEGLGQLAQHIADDPAFSTCLVRQLYRFTTGHLEASEETPAIEALAEDLAEGGFDLPSFLPHLMASPQFRTLAIPE